MKKTNMVVLLVTILWMIALNGCKSSHEKSVNPGSKQYTVAIFSPLYHTSLNDEITGFKMGLSEKGYKEGTNLKFISYNANGDFSKMSQLIESIYTQKPDLLFVVTTPAATEAAKLCTKYQISTVYGAVTDPVNA